MFFITSYHTQFRDYTPLHFTPCLRNPQRNLPHLSHHVNPLKLCAMKKCPPTSRFSVTQHEHNHTHDIRLVNDSLWSTYILSTEFCIQQWSITVAHINTCVHRQTCTHTINGFYSSKEFDHSIITEHSANPPPS